VAYGVVAAVCVAESTGLDGLLRGTDDDELLGLPKSALCLSLSLASRSLSAPRVTEALFTLHWAAVARIDVLPLPQWASIVVSAVAAETSAAHTAPYSCSGA
jgi:hypothetical protein